MEQLDELATALAQAVRQRLFIEVEASGRHVHLSREAVEVLFGPGHQLTPVKELSQPGQFACQERVTLHGPKGSLTRVVVLGPERSESQVEISQTDALALGHQSSRAPKRRYPRQRAHRHQHRARALGAQSRRYRRQPTRAYDAGGCPALTVSKMVIW